MWEAGKVLKEARKQRGLTQKQLGELMGMSYQQIGQYENGKRLPKMQTLERFSKALKIDFDTLYSMIDPYSTVEVRCRVYTNKLEYLVDLIKNDKMPLDKKQKETLINDIKNDIEKIKKEALTMKNEEIEAYSFNMIIKHSNIILDKIIHSLKNYDVSNIIDLLYFYLNVSSTAQDKIIDYAEDLHAVPLYKK